MLSNASVFQAEYVRSFKGESCFVELFLPRFFLPRCRLRLPEVM